jgi:hypothetical protein
MEGGGEGAGRGRGKAAGEGARFTCGGGLRMEWNGAAGARAVLGLRPRFHTPIFGCDYVSRVW